MKLSYFLFLIPILLFGCNDDLDPNAECIYNGIIEDQSGMDGCGFLIKADNGEYLLPVWRWGWCGTPPMPEGYYEDPLVNFSMEDGRRIRFGFIETDEYSNVCMMGRPVIITCIEELPTTGDSH